MSERLPGMVFDRYWPARHPGGTDYAQGRSQRVRRFYWLAFLLGPLAPAVLAVIRPDTRTIGLIVLGVLVLMALGIVVAAMLSPAPPTGVYEVDENGEPLEYVGTLPPIELRSTRPVTYEAFIESVEARRPGGRR